jgi:dUTP pyrophosphatase
MEVQWIKAHPDAILPRRAYNDPLTGDAGFDIFSVEDITVPANSSVEVKVGLEIGNVSPGIWLKIEGRSGLGFNHGVSPHFGVIDNNYRSAVGVKLYNSTGKDHFIEKGKAVAQLIVCQMIPCEMSFTETQTESSRGKFGFGSTDNTHSNDK